MRAVMRAHVRGAQRVTHARALQPETRAMGRLGLCYALHIGFIFLTRKQLAQNSKYILPLRSTITITTITTATTTTTTTATTPHNGH